MAAIVAILKDVETGAVLGVISLAAKTFTTGSTGYHGAAKIDLDGARHQAQVQVVRIGSKSGGKPDSEVVK